MRTHSAPVPPSDRISLKQRVLNAGAWSLAGYGLSQAIRFGTNLLLARLLMPEMFGVMAIATMVMVALALFTDLGLRQVIVQSRRGNDQLFLNTAWVTQILRGVVLWLGALCIALLIFLANYAELVPKGSVYADPSLPYVIAVLSVSVVIGSFSTTKLHEASRNLALGRVTTIEITGQVSGLLCMIAWVSVDRSVWALVAGSICLTLVSVTLGHAWLPGAANRWQWDRSAFTEIIQFGKWIFASSALGFLVTNGDRLLLGALVDATVLGVYVIAVLIFSSFEQILTKLIIGISFPALSEVARERPNELKRTYYRFHAVIASAAYFCSGVLMTSGQALVGLLYDRRYAQAGWILEALAAALLTLPFQIAVQSFMALGKPRLLTNVTAVRVVALFVVTPIGFHLFGLAGAVWGIVSSYFLGLPIIIAYTLKHGLFDLRRELQLLPLAAFGIGVGLMLSFAIGYPRH